MKRTSKTQRLLFLVRIKNVLIFLIVFLLLLWLFRFVYNRLGSSQEFWSFLDRLAQ